LVDGRKGRRADEWIGLDPIAPSARNVGATNTDPLVGSWQTMVMPDGRPIPLTIKITRVQLCETSGELRHGQSRSSILETEDSGRNQGTYFRSLRRSNGGFCDALAGGYITLTDVPKTTSDFVIKNNSDVAVDSGKLTRVSS
jgi:hypothetical protein